MRYHPIAGPRARAGAAMALSKLSGDEGLNPRSGVPWTGGK